MHIDSSCTWWVYSNNFDLDLETGVAISWYLLQASSFSWSLAKIIQFSQCEPDDCYRNFLTVNDELLLEIPISSICILLHKCSFMVLCSGVGRCFNLQGIHAYIRQPCAYSCTHCSILQGRLRHYCATRWSVYTFILQKQYNGMAALQAHLQNVTRLQLHNTSQNM